MPARSRYRACEHGIDLSGNAPEDMEDVAARTQSCSPAHHSAELVPTSHSLTLHTRPVIPQSSRSQGDRIPLGAGSSDSHHLFSSVRHRRAQLSMTDAADCLPVPPWPRSARMVKRWTPPGTNGRGLENSHLKCPIGQALAMSLEKWTSNLRTYEENTSSFKLESATQNRNLQQPTKSR